MKNKKVIIISLIAIIAVIAIIICIVLFANNSKKSNENSLTNETASTTNTNVVLSEGAVPQNNSLMKYVPPITAGTIGNTVETDKGVSINVLNLQLEEYQAYIALSQQYGFTLETDTTSNTNTILYSAKNANGILMRTSYSTDSKKMSLVVSQQ